MASPESGLVVDNLENQVLMTGIGPGPMVAFDAPPVARTVAQARSLLMRQDVASTLRAAAGADVLAYAPGPLKEDAALVASGGVSREDMDRLIAEGAEASVLGRVIDAQGNEVSHDLSQRTIALTIDQMRGFRTQIAYASGLGRGLAMATAARTGLANVVITDSLTAGEMLLAVHADFFPYRRAEMGQESQAD